jgi:ribonuclease HI
MGAWAFVLVDTATKRALECADAVRETTSNRMELTAVIEALSALRRPRQRVLVLSDSRYVVDCGGRWIRGWKRRGWKRKDGPLKNVDLLQRLDELAISHDIEWKWVRGHAGELGNERVDALANQAMDRLMAHEPTRWERRLAWKGGLL